MGELLQNSDECLPPLLEQTPGGNTVFYKGRYLYSKRQPKKQIEATIASLNSLERTLFIFISPALGYGASALINVIPASSFLVFVEYEAQLGTLFEMSFWNDFKLLQKTNVQYLCTQNVRDAVKKIVAFTSLNFKSLQIIRGCAGFALHEEFYTELHALLEDEMSMFWKNRITLIEMARLYSRNIFKWLRHITESNKRVRARFKVLPQGVIEKPVLVVGAGPSLEESISFLKENSDSFFVLAVDVALPTLSALDIAPDAVLLLEGQYWVEHSFLLSKYRNIPLFASITSTPHVFNILQGDIFLYAVDFAPLNFLKNVKQTIASLPTFATLGSVGLIALELSLFITKKDVPIFHTGLDFSYNKGFTHARSSMHPQNITVSSTRLQGLYGASSFPIACKQVRGKSDTLLWSTPTLITYAQMYKKCFLKYENIFDIGKSGLVLRDEVMSEEKIKQYLKSSNAKMSKAKTLEKSPKFEALLLEDVVSVNVQSLLEDERQRLHLIKDMLKGARLLNYDVLVQEIKSSNYLYLHFPDYHSLTACDMTSSAFLKRIRIEVEYFLKIIE